LYHGINQECVIASHITVAAAAAAAAVLFNTLAAGKGVDHEIGFGGGKLLDMANLTAHELGSHCCMADCWTLTPSLLLLLLCALAKGAHSVGKGGDHVFGLGGGRLLDMAKLAASELSVHVVICPYLALTDAPCRTLSVFCFFAKVPTVYCQERRAGQGVQGAVGKISH
jgi:glycerol dehydrogenase-like iron-containing ADH family enzyme